MLRVLAIAALLASLLLGGTNSAIGAATGEIKFYPTYQLIQFPITNAGVIGGLGTTDIILWSSVTRVRANSSRVGWGSASVCQASGIQADGSCTMEGTPNNETRMQWSVEANGKTYWFNLDPNSTEPWKLTGIIPGAPEPKLLLEDGADYFVEYGKYEKSSILFDGKKRQTTIKFACNLLVGLTKNGVTLGDVKGVFYNSDETGWFDKSSATGTIATDASGNLQAVIGNMPRLSQRGFFLFLLKNGSQIWLNTGFNWVFQGASIATNGEDGSIAYKVLGADAAEEARHLLLLCN